MQIPKLSADVEVIQKLRNSPNIDDGLTAEQLKAKFDQGAKAIKEYINDELVPGVEKVLSDTATLKVTIDSDTNTASHNATQIYEHIEGGGNVTLLIDDNYIPVKHATTDAAEFETHEIEDNVKSVWIIDSGAGVEHAVDEIASTTYVDRVIGDTVLHTEQNLTPKQKAQARDNIGAASAMVETPEEYFNIALDGVISLKPEYRGASVKGSETLCPDGISDNGIGNVGSKNNELPENIVIPDVVNEIAVTGLANGMFLANERVKSITIPSVIKHLSPYFARQALNLEELKGTENLKELGQGALYKTPIKKAIFPNLEKMADAGMQFMNCSCLISADLGRITSIPKKAFTACERLSCVYNADNVASVGEQAFWLTRRLKNLNFLPKLTQIGANGFRCSRVDFDWSSLTDCEFGTDATVLQYNPTDWWSGCTYTPCNTPMRSVFDQEDPRWVNDTIGNTSITYKTGCMIVSAAMIYSAFESKDLASPREFEAVVKAINPSLMDLDTTQMPNIKAYLEAVGYTVEHKQYNAGNLQAMYDALSNGALILASTDEGTSGNNWNHAVVVHGINADGELLIQDSSGGAVKYFGRNETATYAMPIQNVTGDEDVNGFLIVTKN